MAEDKSSKTEKPTPRKLQKAREEGQVAKSRDIPMVVSFIWAAAFIAILWEEILQSLKVLMQETGKMYEYTFSEAADRLVSLSIDILFYKITLPFLAVAAILGIASNIAQFGFLVAPKGLQPKGEKIDPIKGFGRIFGVKSMLTMVLNLIKVSVIMILVYQITMDALKFVLHDVNLCDVLCLEALNRHIYWELAKYLAALFVVIAMFDLIKEKQSFIKDQMMSLRDIKQETKDTMGDPQIIRARKQMGFELSNQKSVKEVIAETKVLVKDVGVTIALKYVEGETPLPIILAIGKGKDAQQMESVARTEKIKVVENPKLVAVLIEEGKVDQYIPDNSISEAAKAIRQARG